jgi:ProP effector
MSVHPPPTTPGRLARDLIEVFQDFWPQTFSVYEARRRPLKIGIHRDLEAAADGAITAAEIEIALRSYTRNVGYLRACKENAARINLDGGPAGSVSTDDAANAAHQLLTYKRKKELARAAANTAATPPADAALRRLSLDDLRAAAAERRLGGAA